MEYFKGIVTYLKEGDDGMLKQVNEEYLTQAVNYTDAETKFSKFFEESVTGTFSVVKIDKFKLTEIVDYDGDHGFFIVKAFYNEATDSGKAGKKVPQIFLVNAKDIFVALEKAKDHTNQFLVDLCFTEVKECKILEVFELMANVEYEFE